MTPKRYLTQLSLVLLTAINGLAIQVSDTRGLVAAINNGKPGDTIEIAAGKYELRASLEPKSGMTIKGAGMDKTIITHVPAWKPSTKTLPDPETKLQGMDNVQFVSIEFNQCGRQIDCQVARG